MRINKTNALMTTLDVALSQCRPHAAPQTLAFTHWLRNALPKKLRAIAHFDKVNNLHIDNRTDTKHRTFFVAHVDTVHRLAGANNVIKSDALWTAGSPQQCLGADDGAGVALLMHMLHHNVPGYYLFTQGEECGGIGAKHLASEYAQLLMEFDRAVAFDRKGISDVITHQGWGRCCSDEFAQALAQAINETAPDYLMLTPDDTGVYTDTAEFVDLIPECTNISVGYEGAHGDKESLGMDYYKQLSVAVLCVAWDALPTKRDPLQPEPEDDSYWGTWQTQWLSTGTKIKTKHMPSKLSLYSMECALQDALDMARIGSLSSLVNLIAESIYPEDPQHAQRLLNRNLLSDESYLYWAQGCLDEGVPALDVMEDMFYECQMH